MTKNRKFLIILIVSIFMLLQLWFFYVTFSYQSTTINVEQNDKGQWFISYIHKPYGNFEVGDIIIEVNRNTPDKHFTIQKWHVLQQVEEVLLLRDGNLVIVDSDSIDSFFSSDYLPLIGEIMCILIGILIFKKLPSTYTTNLFSFVFIIAGAIFMCVSASVRGDTLAKVIIIPLLLSLPIVFLHFLINFFNEKGGLRLPTKFIKYLYYSVTILGLSQFVYFTNSNYVFSIYRAFHNIALTTFFTLIVINLIFLARMYLKFRKQQSFMSLIVKTILISMIISFLPIILLSFVPAILFGYEWVDSSYTGWFVLFFPITFAYLIAAKKIYDINTVIRRAVFTTIIAAVPSIIILIADIFIFHNQLSLKHATGLFITSTIVISIALYSLEYMVTKFHAIIFPRKHYLQNALKKISKNLTTITALRELREAVLVDIVDILEVYGGAVAVRYRNKIEIISEGNISLYDVEQLVLKAQVTDNYEQWSYSCFEIGRHGESTSYLIFTKKKNGAVLSLDERNWLSMVVSYLAVSLENLYLIRKLTIRMEELSKQLPTESNKEEFIWFRKLMFEIQEQERFRIAGELHDTTMQDLFYLKRRMASLLNQIEENGFILGMKEFEELRGITEYMEIVNINLRQNCFELNPQMLGETGLNAAIWKLADQEGLNCPFQIELITSGEQLLENKDLDTKRHIFRIFQELINNAKKHSMASKVKLAIGVTTSEINIFYEDDGVGFEPKEHYLNPTGIGLEQLRSRVIFLNGSMNLKASKGKGVRYHIVIPNKSDITEQNETTA